MKTALPVRVALRTRSLQRPVRFRSSASSMASLLPSELLTSSGRRGVKEGAAVALYFGSDWCPECQNVLPTITKFYAAANAPGHNLEIVYVSSDRTEAEFKSTLSAQPWLAVPFSDAAARTELKRKYGVCAGVEAGPLAVARKAGIPSLVVLDSKGNVLEFDGVKAAFSGTAGAAAKAADWAARAVASS